MQFLTKNMIREKLEDFLIGYDDRCRILYSEDTEKEFIHIGTAFEKIKSKFQTTLLEEERREFFKEKDTRQGIFSEHKEKDFSR